MQGAGAAEGEQGEVARVVAALERHEPDGARHLVIGDAHDGAGHLVRRQPEVRADLGVEDLADAIEGRRPADAEQPRRIEPPQQEIGVGDRGLRPAAPVADRPGIGARALRPHLQDSRRAHPRDRAAARADRVDVDHGHAHGQAVAHLLVCAQRGPATADDADVEARPAHVAGDDVLVPGRQRRVGGGLHAGGGSRHERAHGVARRDVDRHGAAIALHDEELVPVPLRREIGRELAQVAVDDRLHERIDRRGGPPLELAVLGQELGAHRDVGVGPFGRGDLARPPLVRIVQVGMDEVDHERLGALRPEPARRLAHLVLGEGHDDLALGVHALVDLEAQIARDQRLEAALEPVRRGARAPSQLEHVAEAPRRDEPRPRALALEQRIGRGGRPVHDHLQLGRPRRRARQRRLHTRGLVGDRGRHLRHAHLPGGLIDEHEIGEGPAHIHPDQLGLRHRSAPSVGTG